MIFRKVCGRGERIGLHAAVAVNAIKQDVLGQKLGLANLATYRAAGGGIENKIK
jgi:hypothetical protein